jgi:hypothetical protein
MAGTSPAMTKIDTRNSSCPALCRASTSLLPLSEKDVDGRDKPGHYENRHAKLDMPGLGPGIHVFNSFKEKDVDGRDKPGHDENRLKTGSVTCRNPK